MNKFEGVQKPFSAEVHNKFLDGKGNSVALETLHRLRNKKNESGLFADQNNDELERIMEAFPDEYEMLTNQEAFQQLTPAQQAQVMFKRNNMGTERPEKPKVYRLEDN